MAFKDETGNRYGRLEVLSYHSRSEGKARHPRFLCKCDCGNEVVVLGTNLRRNHTTSCGCFHKESTSEAKKTHGMRNTPTYKSWCSMKERCLNSNSKLYEGYGTDGIKIHQPWIDSFETFLEDMGVRPEGTSLDRIDPHKDYTPCNCRWADSSNQAFNKTLKVTNTSGKTGVCYDKKRKTWVARITCNYEHIYLGSFKDKKSAIDARLAAEMKYFGYYLKGQDG